METFKIILEHLLEVIIAVLIPILVVLGKWFIRYLEKKLHFDMSEAQEERLLEYLEQGIAYAEEKAQALLKVDPSAMTPSQQKLDTAIAFVKEQIQRNGWDDIAGEKLASMIEAALNKSR